MALVKRSASQILVFLGCDNELVVAYEGPELLKMIIGGQDGLADIEIPGDELYGRVFTDTDPPSEQILHQVTSRLAAYRHVV